MELEQSRKRAASNSPSTSTTSSPVPSSSSKKTGMLNSATPSSSSKGARGGGDSSSSGLFANVPNLQEYRDTAHALVTAMNVSGGCNICPPLSSEGPVTCDNKYQLIVTLDMGAPKKVACSQCNKANAGLPFLFHMEQQIARFHGLRGFNRKEIDELRTKLNILKDLGATIPNVKVPDLSHLISIVTVAHDDTIRERDVLRSDLRDSRINASFTLKALQQSADSLNAAMTAIHELEQRLSSQDKKLVHLDLQHKIDTQAQAVLHQATVDEITRRHADELAQARVPATPLEAILVGFTDLFTKMSQKLEPIPSRQGGKVPPPVLSPPAAVASSSPQTWADKCRPKEPRATLNDTSTTANGDMACIAFTAALPSGKLPSERTEVVIQLCNELLLQGGQCASSVGNSKALWYGRSSCVESNKALLIKNNFKIIEDFSALSGVDESSSQAVRSAISGRVAWLLAGLDDYTIRDVVLDDIPRDENILAECFVKEAYYRQIRRRKVIPHTREEAFHKDTGAPIHHAYNRSLNERS